MNVNSCYMNMWHATQKSTLLFELFLLQTAPNGGGQGDTHKAHDEQVDGSCHQAKHKTLWEADGFGAEFSLKYKYDRFAQSA